ncbi:MAG: efflux RND transporter periplasmic adaptor subunit [Nevskiaceae bacterium]|jgi:membrane fusion protein (multidrug efflux system)|nr:efflux RND transporter periplasmic adaptor subunit [Nevskiaceae bacterium]
MTATNRQDKNIGCKSALPILLACLASIGACSRQDAAGGGRGAQTGPVQVGYVELRGESVPLLLELPGRTTAYETSEVRPQVSGIVRERLFTEGAVVQAGDLLYRIDPRVYEAALAQARADLSSATAANNAARMRAERYAELAKTNVISQQDLLDAQSTAEAAAAAVERAKAGTEAAQLNLQFTRVTAPIAGRIGRSFVTTGALVSAAQATPLATIQRLDPIFVDIQQSSSDLLNFRRQVAGGNLARTSTAVQLKLEDGSSYPHAGVLEFAESVVDSSTGSVTVRARFPNTEGLLLPGMFVRAQFAPVQAQDAVLVPQQGVQRDARGNAQVLIVNAESKAELRSVVAERTVGENWLVSGGLRSGEHVIVEGLSRVRAGDSVNAVPAAITATSGDVADPSGANAAAATPSQ